MAFFCRNSKKLQKSVFLFTTQTRFSNTLGGGLIEAHRKPTKLYHKRPPENYSSKYQEFLPQTDVRKRDCTAELLERNDMLLRRQVINVPEFYVGSIMAVTIIDPHSPNKHSRFVGICIQKTDVGLRSNFTLRNTVEDQGVEITYDMYCPLVTAIEVLKLEKRLDGELFYLRDAPLEFSTFPFNLAPLQHNPNEAVPVNTLKVPLKPRPWHERWERQDLQGILPLELPEKLWKKSSSPDVCKPWLKHDLMKQYRESTNEKDTEHIMAEIFTKISQREESKRSNVVKNNTGVD